MDLELINPNNGRKNIINFTILRCNKRNIIKTFYYFRFIRYNYLRNNEAFFQIIIQVKLNCQIKFIVSQFFLFVSSSEWESDFRSRPVMMFKVNNNNFSRPIFEFHSHC